MGKTLLIPADVEVVPSIMETAAKLDFNAVVGNQAIDELTEESIVQAAGAARADGIFPMPDPATEIVLDAARALGFAGLGSDTCVTQKALFWKSVAMPGVFQNNGIPQPWGRRFRAFSEEEICTVAQYVAAPLVVKPAGSYGGRGIRIVRHLEDVPLAAKIAAKIAIKLSDPPDYLVEAYVPGNKFCVDALVIDRKAIVMGIIEELPPEGYACACAAVAPARVQHIVDMSDITQRVADALEMEQGHLQVEFGYDEPNPKRPAVKELDGLCVIRLGACPAFYRYGADLIGLSGGTDTVAAAMLYALGENVSAPRESTRGAAAVWLRASSGVVKDVAGLDEARAMPGVVHVQVNARPGETVGHPVDYEARDKLGRVVAVGANADEALDNARCAAETCKILTSPTY